MIEYTNGSIEKENEILYFLPDGNFFFVYVMYRHYDSRYFIYQLRTEVVTITVDAPNKRVLKEEIYQFLYKRRLRLL